MSIRTFAALGLLLSTSFSFAADLSRWPAFLGPIPDGLKAESLPIEWTPTSNVAWKAPLPGYGQSSVVTWEGTAYVTSISGENKEKCHLTAIAVGSGDVLWTHTFDAASQAKNTDYISKAAPSPVADADGVVAFFESGDLVACTPKGDVRWQRNLIEEYGAVESRHGLASSLVQMGDRVFVWVERDGAPYVMAVEKSTGKNLWKVDGLGSTAWGSPILFPVDGETQLILSASGKLAGYDPANGKQLWKLEGLSGNTVPTPQPAGTNRLLIGATSGRGESAAPSGGAKSNGLVEIKKSGDGTFAADYVWRADNATSSFGSPIVHQGFAYFVNRVGVLFCLDLETGEEKYTQRIGGSVWATPLAVEERIYFVGKDGETTVVQAGPEYKKIAENRLWEPAATPAAPAAGERPGAPAAGGPVQYSVAAVDGQLLIRAGSEVFCLRKSIGN